MFFDTKSRVLVPCALFALVGPTLAPAGPATPAGSVPTRHVSYTDLNLTRKSSVAVLYARIKSASDEVCEPLSSLDLQLYEVTRRCRAQAIANAVADVNARLLTELYESTQRSSTR